MIVIGEKINASIKAVGEAITKRDSAFITELAVSQARAGADFIDVNTGTGTLNLEQEKEAMVWLVDTVQAVTEKPLTIDSDRLQTIESQQASIGDARFDRQRLPSTRDQSRGSRDARPGGHDPKGRGA